MNWQHLIYFKKIAECEHLTRASEELHISPSALSKAIASLEEEIGLVLFEKSGRNIQLNRYGKYFYDYVCKAMEEINTGVHFIQRAANVCTGSVRLCSIFSPGTNYLPELLSRFYNTYPNIHIELSQNMTQHILDGLLNNDLDLGICSEFRQEDDYVSIARDLLYCEEIYLAVPVNHPLAEKEEVCFNDIKNEIFIGYNSSTGIASTIHSAIARKTDSDFRLKTIFSANEPNTITYMVSKGLGIGFVVENPSLYTTPVKVLPITDLSFYHPIYLVWKNTSYMSPAANEFRQFILCNRKLRTPCIRPSF